TFTHAYHGDTLGAVAVGGIDIFHAAFRPLLFPTVQIPAPYCYRCPYGEKSGSCGMRCASELERVMEEQHAEVAGLVIEPLLQGAGGMIVHPEGFLRKVRELCSRYGILMIADEVAVGFGRTGSMFASDREEVTPDLMALSKGITAGYLPLAATLATQEVYDMFLGEYREMKTFFHGHTFTGNPLACAAALASLRLFESDRLLERLRETIEHFSGRMRDLARLPHVGEARHVGMAGGVELVAERENRTPYPWEEGVGVRVCREARKHGLFLRPLGNVIVVFPPLCITGAELDILFDGIERAITAVTGV
ncbi:MAG TPA: aminotransferase class III-fold pyridoxal phosphate-dependent enzyme, partial [Verrucomicrobiae bacterium]|nr:aminotransferase class III-fold pyridoxal phosphate-dependent enzyme [Verrucomicrobiae bacterium]